MRIDFVIYPYSFEWYKKMYCLKDNHLATRLLMVLKGRMESLLSNAQ